jgi:hypothetical protein
MQSGCQRQPLLQRAHDGRRLARESPPPTPIGIIQALELLPGSPVVVTLGGWQKEPPVGTGRIGAGYAELSRGTTVAQHCSDDR